MYQFVKIFDFRIFGLYIKFRSTSSGFILFQFILRLLERCLLWSRDYSAQMTAWNEYANPCDSLSHVTTVSSG